MSGWMYADICMKYNGCLKNFNDIICGAVIGMFTEGGRFLETNEKQIKKRTTEYAFYYSLLFCVPGHLLALYPDIVCWNNCVSFQGAVSLEEKIVISIEENTGLKQPNFLHTARSQGDNG